MQEKNNKKNLLVQNVLDASVNFQVNGDFMILPCPWEDEKQVTDGSVVRYRGGIEVEPGGKTKVKCYKEGTKGPRYNLIFETAHGKVFASKRWKTGNRPSERKVIVRFEFPKSYPLPLILKLYKEECEEMILFFRKSKEETIWK